MEFPTMGIVFIPRGIRAPNSRSIVTECAHVVAYAAGPVVHRASAIPTGLIVRSSFIPLHIAPTDLGAAFLDVSGVGPGTIGHRAINAGTRWIAMGKCLFARWIDVDAPVTTC